MTPATATQIGRPVNRVDGRLKVTGQAKYAAEFDAPGLTHGVVVSSAIAKGRIKKIDVEEALKLNGVLQVFTHENRPKVASFDRNYKDEDAPGGSPFRPLYDDKVMFSGQPVALVVAETLELAQYAASLVRVEYKSETHHTDLDSQLKKARQPSKEKGGFEPPPKPRGKAEKAFAKAPVRVQPEYLSPVEHHNPIEMHASTVICEDDGTLTVYDKTQGAPNSQRYVMKVFGLSKEEVRVLSPFVGGAFGSGLR